MVHDLIDHILVLSMHRRIIRRYQSYFYLLTKHLGPSFFEGETQLSARGASAANGYHRHDPLRQQLLFFILDFRDQIIDGSGGECVLPNSFNITSVFGLGPDVDGQYIILKSLTVLQTYFILIPNNSLYALLNICGVAPSGQRRKLNFKIILGVEFRNCSRQHSRIVGGR